MNKITSVLAGIAVAATASIAPAFAQGTFTNTGPFTFLDNGTIAGVFSAPATFNPTAGASETGTLNVTLTGGPGGANTGTQLFSGVSLFFSPTAPALPVIFDNSFTPGATVNFAPSVTTISSITNSAAGNSFVLSLGAPVPESSTVVSFGALLALGGLTVVLRRKGVKNAT